MTGIIHRDFHHDNIILINNAHQAAPANNQLIKEPSQLANYGILDFGDSNYSYNVFDLAIAMANSVFCFPPTPNSPHPDSFERAGHLLAGYLSVTSLKPIERDVLYTCISCRIIQDITCAEHDSALQTEPNEYLISCVDIGRARLRELHKLGKQGFYSILQSVLDLYAYNLNDAKLAHG